MRKFTLHDLILPSMVALATVSALETPSHQNHAPTKETPADQLQANREKHERQQQIQYCTRDACRTIAWCWNNSLTAHRDYIGRHILCYPRRQSDWGCYSCENQ